MASHAYTTWGKLRSMTGTLATTLGVDNPFRYRGYYYDTETGLYYLQSRYYDPETCRFLNGDVLMSTGQGVLGYNMFAYCGNNPVKRLDPAGVFWEEIGDFLRNTFGAGSETIVEAKGDIKESVPYPASLLGSFQTSVSEVTVEKERGDSTKPISVYAVLSMPHVVTSSSAGLKINVSNFTLTLNLAADNIGLYGSVKRGNSEEGCGVRVNIPELKVGFEGSVTTQTSKKQYTTVTTNVSVTGYGILAVAAFVTTGNWVYSTAQ